MYWLYNLAATPAFREISTCSYQHLLIIMKMHFNYADFFFPRIFRVSWCPLDRLPARRRVSLVVSPSSVHVVATVPEKVATTCTDKQTTKKQTTKTSITTYTKRTKEHRKTEEEMEGPTSS
jgi:hypothetical protein